MTARLAGFDYAPRLDGDKVRLRPFKESDWRALYGVASDPMIWEVHPRPDRWRAGIFRDFFDDAMQQDGGMIIESKETGEVIGGSRYSARYTEPGEIEIGWTFLARAYWGGETNRDVKHTMLKHAFRFVDTVIFRVGISNARSRRAMEKIGGFELRRWHDDENPDVMEHVVYAITKEGFLK